MSDESDDEGIDLTRPEEQDWMTGDPQPSRYSEKINQSDETVDCPCGDEFDTFDELRDHISDCDEGREAIEQTLRDVESALEERREDTDSSN